jgi:hypothetical protein
MDFWTITMIVAAVVAGLTVIAFIFSSLWIGGIVLFSLAAVQGFVGIAAFIACWIFLFPLMLAASFLVGAVTIIVDMRNNASVTRDPVRLGGKKALETGAVPPPRPEMGTREYYEWANREGRYRDT